MSSELAELIDNYSTKRQARLDAKHHMEALQEEETKLNRTIIETMSAAGLSAAGGSLAIVKLKKTMEPTVEDWGLFYEHIRTTNQFDLLHKRMGAGAVKLRWDDNVKVPGVTTYEVSKLTIGKANV